ncbi:MULTISPECIES: alpha/beta fold hydrolase [unclassified Caulobacter]|uniref:alpha/beta fold hydrolase n=1 Tax=unclassified Caulobacter TaxID=2648921 RepID=UPI0006F8B2E3|nr:MULTISPECIES: alpha/beta fold hydrolase [unclassified Caulobacter]KQV56151.1 alpha/beta hydrolase [Caulobacter sp. Root342]KQV70674.1 alpha/beta hydrolase [Caulobacter sp. Root343]
MTPILLIPGLLCSEEIFAPQLPALWPHGPVTIAQTLAGDTIADMAARILADAPPRFALVGVSMGGYLSFEILRQARERVAKLALVCTSARPDTPEQTAGRRKMLEQARAVGFERFCALGADALTHPSRKGDPELNAISMRMGRAVGLEAFARQTEAVIGRVDSRPLLGSIKVPTVIVVGDTDPLTPAVLSEEMAAAIPGAKLVIAPTCGHVITLERPEVVNDALVGWLEG